MSKSHEELTTEQLESINLKDPHVNRDEIHQLIGFKPKNLDYYRRALVHKSIKKHAIHFESNNQPIQDYMKESFERMEFLGDAVLNLIVANLLYDRYPDKDEGFMTRLRTKIVRSSNCSYFAKCINLGKYILAGYTIQQNYKDNNNRIDNDRILEDAFESLLGAIYKDLGLPYAEHFLLKLINTHLNFDELLSIDDNYKDILMRYTQINDYELPIYELMSINNNDNDDKTIKNKLTKTFTVSVTLKEHNNDHFIKNIGIGTGSTKKEAEQNACKNALCSHNKVDCMKNNKNCIKIHKDEIKDIINRTKKIESDNEIVFRD